MDDLKYVIKRNNWNDLTSILFLPLLKNDPFISMDDWKEGVKSGSLGLFNVWNAQGEIIAAFIVRIDESPKANELVIVAAAGNTPQSENGMGLYDLITPYVVQLANKAECTYMRAHTDRLGVTKLLERAGYETEEYICRLEIANYEQ
ncbi:MAG: hypothetical protein JKY93_03140 [Gammaproteobacteria bacterium]|nr:hypothetical protein [Gammaproteobacteria bacterium]